MAASSATTSYAEPAIRRASAPPSRAAPGRDDDVTTGHGLAGMRERVALYGGTLETGPREHGRGFRVRATIPFDG